jgi:hypothetical protein
LAARSTAAIPAAACIVGLAIIRQFYHLQRWQRRIGVVFRIAPPLAVID